MKIEKIELKHLSPYLPYGLNCKSQGFESEIYKTTGISKEYVDLIWIYLENVKNQASQYSAVIEDVYPILRPLSDLTKEIEHNGEKFVPLKKLHELLETNFFCEIKYLKRIFVDNVISIEHFIPKHEKKGNDCFILKYKVETSNMGNLIYSLTYSQSLRRFIIRDETNSRPLGHAYHYDLFQKLFEYHIDIFGLIENNLAIDKNTLK